MTFGAGVVPRSNAVDTACAFVPALDVGMAEEAALRRRLCIPVGVHLSRLQFESNLCLSSSALASLPLSVRLAVPKRQSEFLAGRRCARQALAQGGEAVHELLPLGGDRLPIWPSGWVGCISHSAGTAIAMVGPSAIYRGVGIDVEALIKSPVLESIRPGVATVEEMACTGVQDQSLALTLIFSGKEALFKALYPQVRRILDFSAAQLVSISEEWMEFVLAEDWSSVWRAGCRFLVRYAVYEGHVYTAVLVPRTESCTDGIDCHDLCGGSEHAQDYEGEAGPALLVGSSNGRKLTAASTVKVVHEL
jgi:enterobactin synthetase component D